MRASLASFKVKARLIQFQRHNFSQIQQKQSEFFGVCLQTLKTVHAHLPVEDEQLEEGVHEQDPVGLYGGGVQEDGLGRAVEGVGVQDGLDHHQAVRQVLPQQAGAVEGGLVRGVVEDL